MSLKQDLPQVSSQPPGKGLDLRVNVPDRLCGAPWLHRESLWKEFGFGGSGDVEQVLNKKEKAKETKAILEMTPKQPHWPPFS